MVGINNNGASPRVRARGGRGNWGGALGLVFALIWSFGLGCDRGHEQSSSAASSEESAPNESGPDGAGPTNPTAETPAPVEEVEAVAEPIPVHRWVYVEVGEERMLAFTYRDSAAGLSAKGGVVGAQPTPEEAAAASRPARTVRLPGFPVTPLGDAEVARLGLPEQPDWLHFFLPDPNPFPWRSDPLVSVLLHPEYPDDLEALFIFPEARVQERPWVRLTGSDPSLDGGYQGQLLNTPHTPSDLRAGSSVTVRYTPGFDGMVWISDTVRGNLAAWNGACQTCGCDVVAEPIDALVERQFGSNPDADVVQFTTRCVNCGGTMHLQRRSETALPEQ